MSISKDLLPKKNQDKVISLKAEPKTKKPKKTGKVTPLVEPAAASSGPVRGNTLKSRKLLQEQAEYQVRVDAALSQIPDILTDLRETRNDIQKNMLRLKEDQQLSSERMWEELKWLKESGSVAAKNASRHLRLAVCGMIVLCVIGIFLIYNSIVSSQLLLQKISGIESAVNQSEIKNELREIRRTLSDESRANQQTAGENKKVTQAMAKEIQKLNKAVNRLNEMERFNPHN